MAPIRIKKSKDSDNVEALDFTVLLPSNFYGLTNKEAEGLYSMWSKSPSGEKIVGEYVDKDTLMSLKVKGYISGSSNKIVQLTEKGKKVIVEIVTHSQNSFSRNNKEINYRDIKSAKNNRKRQTFIHNTKSAGNSSCFKTYNLHKVRNKTAGWGDLPKSLVQRFVSDPAKSWFEQKKDVAKEWMAGLKGSKCIRVYDDLVGRSKLNIQSLDRAQQQANSPQGLNPNVLLADPNYLYMLKQVENFYDLTEKDKSVIPDPRKYLSNIIKGRMDSASFSNFRSDFERAVSIVTKQECINYEKEKSNKQEDNIQPKMTVDQIDLGFIMSIKSLVSPLRWMGLPSVDLLLDQLDNAMINGNSVNKILTDSLSGITDERQIPNAAWVVMKDVIDPFFDTIDRSLQKDNTITNKATLDRARKEIYRIKEKTMGLLIPTLTNKFRMIYKHRYEKETPSR